MKIHYALQTCDSFNNQIDNRYSGTTKKEITWKCATSFFNAVRCVSKINREAKHIVKIFDDRSSQETYNYLSKLCQVYSDENVEITLQKTKTSGIMQSIRECYEWLYTNGEDLVYQVQDDYLFHENALIEMINVWFQMYTETDSHAMISPWNDNYLWATEYKHRATPRTIVCGASRYWIQYYDTSCSFLTSLKNFKTYWSILEEFLNLPPKGITIGDKKNNLENITINRILTQNGILGLVPITSLALHIQGETEKDPYIDWKQWWDSVKIIGE